VKVVLFDLGGTLIDDTRISWRELNRIGFAGLCDSLSKQGFSLPSTDEVCAVLDDVTSRDWEWSLDTLRCRSIKSSVLEGLRQLGLHQTRYDLEECLRAFHAAVSGEIRMLDGVPSVLEQLVEIGLRMGLVSNTSWTSSMHAETLERLGISRFFDCMVFSSDVGVMKPHPRIFLTALARVSALPGDAVFVGDSWQDDVLGAQRVGMQAVLVKSDCKALVEPSVMPSGGAIAQLTQLPLLLEALG